MIPVETTLGNYGDTCMPMFVAALFIMAKLWKQPRYSTTDEWIKKMWYTMQYYSAIKKNEIMLCVGKWMELGIIMLRVVTQV
jgi:hypothetical protein